MSSTLSPTAESRSSLDKNLPQEVLSPLDGLWPPSQEQKAFPLHSKPTRQNLQSDCPDSRGSFSGSKCQLSHPLSPKGCGPRLRPKDSALESQEEEILSWAGMLWWQCGFLLCALQPLSNSYLRQTFLSSEKKSSLFWKLSAWDPLLIILWSPTLVLKNPDRRPCQGKELKGKEHPLRHV